MMLFDVKCRVLESIDVTDASGRDVTIAPGSYRLEGIDHLIRSATGQTVAAGIDLKFIDDRDGRSLYTVSAENLARFIALDEVEVKP